MKIIVKISAVILLALAGCSSPEGETNPTKSHYEKISPDAQLFERQQAVYSQASAGKFFAVENCNTLAESKVKFSRSNSHSTVQLSDESLTKSKSWLVKLAPKTEMIFDLQSPVLPDPFLLVVLGMKFTELHSDLKVALIFEDQTRIEYSDIFVEAGWGQPAIALKDSQKFSASANKLVKKIGISFPKSKNPVIFNLDDILFVNNRSYMERSPAGLRIYRKALSWIVSDLAGATVMEFSRTGKKFLFNSPVFDMTLRSVSLADGDSKPARFESPEKIMQCEPATSLRILENNPVRLRVEICWYYPPADRGTWSKSTTRKIRYLATAYSDGTVFFQVDLDNTGGKPLSGVDLKIRVPKSAGRSCLWETGKVASQIVEDDFIGPVASWRFIYMEDTELTKVTRNSRFLSPGRVAFANNDVVRDTKLSEAWKFDRSTGVHFSKISGKRCRFLYHPASGGAQNPVFQIAGNWTKIPSVIAGGRAVKLKTITPTGELLFMVEGKFTKPLTVEIWQADRD